jgi:hypothetical protein
MQIINDFLTKNYKFIENDNGSYKYAQVSDKHVENWESFSPQLLNALVEYGYVEGADFLKESTISFQNFVYSDLFKLYNTKAGYLLANRIRSILNNNGLYNVVDKEYLDSIGFKGSSAYEDMFEPLYADYEDLLGDAGIFGAVDLVLTPRTLLSRYVGLSGENVKDIEERLTNAGLSFMSEGEIPQIKNIVIYEDAVKGIKEESTSVQLSYDVLQTKKRLIEKQLSEIDKELTNYRGK